MAEPRDACVHDTWIDGLHFLVVDAQPEFDVWSIIFDDHVSIVTNRKKISRAPIGLEVQGETAFIAVKILEIGP
ncbi:MAG: hypothetical protein Ct9H300mP8_08380 [Gammaproteobacteria bacterium]|nr:MAG: hypothetical protein Ct9H300mP8_08380 [Gammaproteobacteria bacterium]